MKRVSCLLFVLAVVPACANRDKTEQTAAPAFEAAVAPVEKTGAAKFQGIQVKKPLIGPLTKIDPAHADAAAPAAPDAK